MLHKLPLYLWSRIQREQVLAVDKLEEIRA